MDYEEVTENLKNDPDFQKKLELLRREQGIPGELYFICLAETGSFWGLRPRDILQTEENQRFRQALAVSLAELLKQFLKLKQCPEIKIFDNAVEEVEAVLAVSGLKNYATGHGGNLSVVEVQENEGVVYISMSGSCSGCPSSLLTLRNGIENTLRMLIPWVKTVRSTDEPEEPDFGIERAWEEAEKERLDNDGGQR